MLALGTIAQWWLCIFSIRLWSHVCFTCDKRFTTARSHSLGSSMHTVERVTSLLLQEPFALYPGEELVRAPHFTVAGKTNNADYRAGICPLPVVPPHHAIRLQARRLHARRRAGQGRRPVADRRPHHLSPRVARGTYVTRAVFFVS